MKQREFQASKAIRSHTDHAANYAPRTRIENAFLPPILSIARNRYDDKVAPQAQTSDAADPFNVLDLLADVKQRTNSEHGEEPRRSGLVEGGSNLACDHCTSLALGQRRTAAALQAVLNMLQSLEKSVNVIQGRLSQQDCEISALRRPHSLTINGMHKTVENDPGRRSKGIDDTGSSSSDASVAGFKRWLVKVVDHRIEQFMVNLATPVRQAQAKIFESSNMNDYGEIKGDIRRLQTTVDQMKKKLKLSGEIIQLLETLLKRTL